MDNADSIKRCLLDDSKVCDNCGECDRCDLDPNKLCDNCCKCLALEDAESEFRSITIDGKHGFRPGADLTRAGAEASEKAHERFDLSDDEPIELTPELVAYWESRLIECGEAPADDGFGEIEVGCRIPVKGERKLGGRRSRHFEKHEHEHG